MKKIFILFIGFVLIASVSFADDKKTDKDMSFWEKLKTKIEKITPKKKLPITTAVGGVRGVKNESADMLYWKDSEDGIAVSEEELEIFKTALQFAEEGQVREAGAIFEKFMKDFPDSQLSEDARMAVAVIQVEIGGSGAE